MNDSVGDHAQIRLIAEQLVRASIVEVKAEMGEEPKIPASLKFAAALVSGVLTAMITAGCLWMAATLADLKVQVSNVNLQLGEKGALSARLNDFDRRIYRLEKQPEEQNVGRQ